MGVLDGKRAIVTGGGRGIGRGIALALADEGARVSVWGRTIDVLEDVCEEIEHRGGTAISIVCDVCDPEQIDPSVRTVVRELGGIDILVNNAQLHAPGRVLDVSDADVERLFMSGPIAALRMMRACHEHLRGNGAVVNLGSVAAYWAGPIGSAIYGAAKAALGSLTRSVAVEWAPDGIRANVLVPMAETSHFEDYRRRDPDGFAARMRAIPLGRLADPEHEIGRAVVFLVGPDAAMITGTTLPVDGGQLYLR